MTLHQCREKNRKRFNRLRRALRLSETDLFAYAWQNSNDKKRSEIDGWLYLGDISNLESWLESNRILYFEEMTLRQLRNEAKLAGIQYYCRLSKTDLIRGLTDARQNRRTLEDERANGTPVNQVGQSV